MTKPPALLELENVACLRGGRRVLDGLTFRISVGENVAILGPNGSGKTTLLKLLMRELYPLANDGEFRMRILGEESWDLFQLRSHLGIVSTDLQATFARELTAWEAVLSGFFGSVGLWRNHSVTPAMERKARRALQRLEAWPLAGRWMSELSTGEARRVLIARALIHDPQALVLDEPTNSLDLRLVREFRGTLRRLARSGTSLVLVTHSLDDLVPEISRVILLRDGRVFKDGPKERVLTAESLSRLYGMTVRLQVEDGRYHVRS